MWCNFDNTCNECKLKDTGKILKNKCKSGEYLNSQFFSFSQTNYIYYSNYLINEYFADLFALILYVPVNNFTVLLGLNQYCTVLY